MAVPSAIFREYDIRGRVGEEITPALAEAIGKAFGTHVTKRHPYGSSPTVALAHDLRPSSRELADRFASGVTSTGMHVIDIGRATSPLLYFALHQLPVDGGAMITASHNPNDYNGFKLCSGKEALFGEEIQKIRRTVEKGSFFNFGGGRREEQAIIPAYLDHLASDIRLGGKRLKVVIDCGGGAASLVVPELLKRLGCDLREVFADHHPDPTVPENLAALIEEVRGWGADVGIAFDGDADRIGVIDDQGAIVWGDRLTLLFALEILKERPGSIFISEVKASQVFYDEVARLGGKPIMWKTGHSLIKAKMRESGATLAGEMSGHLFFADRYFGYDDAVYAACRLLELLSRTNRSLSGLLSDFPQTCSTPEIRIDCADAIKFDVVEAFRERLLSCEKCNGLRELIDIDGVRAIFEDGWGLVRASNTQPALVLRFEASSPQGVDRIRGFIEEELNKALKEVT